ncbi:hypothetical protein IID22_02130 [Patescibacteria group bacterium]|nr:hypothetical protein [Patescibacteria group bacterium]
MLETVHLHKNRLNRNRNVYLLLIPPLIYVSVLFLFFLGINRSSKDVQIAVDTLEPTVLGEEVGLE